MKAFPPFAFRYRSVPIYILKSPATGEPNSGDAYVMRRTAHSSPAVAEFREQLLDCADQLQKVLSPRFAVGHKGLALLAHGPLPSP